MQQPEHWRMQLNFLFGFDQLTKFGRSQFNRKKSKSKAIYTFVTVCCCITLKSIEPQKFFIVRIAPRFSNVCISISYNLLHHERYDGTEVCAQENCRGHTKCAHQEKKEKKKQKKEKKRNQTYPTNCFIGAKPKTKIVLLLFLIVVVFFFFHFLFSLSLSPFTLLQAIALLNNHNNKCCTWDSAKSGHFNAMASVCKKIVCFLDQSFYGVSLSLSPYLYFSLAFRCSFMCCTHPVKKETYITSITSLTHMKS